MITPEQWYATFGSYNSTWFSVLIVLWVLLIISTLFIFVKPGKQSQRLLKTSLALIFAWNAIVFFFSYMKSSAIQGGVPMLLLSILLIVDIARRRFTFKLPEKNWRKYVTIFLIFWSTILYSILGWLSGHPYPNGPFLMAPCPTVIFTIALFSTCVSSRKADKILFTFMFILLLWWSMYSGLGAPLRNKFYLDFSLFAAGIYGIIMLIRYWRLKEKSG